MLTSVQIYANNLPKDEWVVGRGWIEKKWPEGRFPTKDELDLISNDKPILLERADGHAVIVNSYALSLANISSYYFVYACRSMGKINRITRAVARHR